MAGIDVLGCIAAIVSTFHGAAHLALAVHERSDRRRRRNAASDAELAFQDKMLIRSLSDGELQCKAARDDRYAQYGTAFKIGDAVALSTLKDVIVSLQMDVVSALQVARAMEGATLDLSRLHEASIMNKSNALRAINDLCKRLPEPEAGDALDSQSIRRVASAGAVHMTGIDRPLAVTLPTPPASPQPPRYSTLERSPTRQPSTARQPAAGAMPSRPKKRGFSRMFSGLSVSLTMANDDYGAFRKEADDQRATHLQQAEQERTSPEIEKTARRSLPDSAYGGSGGSQTSSRHRPTASITSTLFSEGSCVTAESYEQAEGTPRNDSDTLPIESVTSTQATQLGLSHSGSTSSSSSSARPSVSHNGLPVTQWEDDDGVMRATLAPEVVTPEYQSMLPRRPARPVPPPASESYSMTKIHPAFRNAFMVDSPAIPPQEPDSVWAPLTRPAKINGYHNFCKGAWQVRDRAEEGLSIAMLPGATGFTVPHWKCKQCQFRSKAMNNATVLPDHVYFASSGVRYRWLFLAKSHIHAGTAQSKPEAYAYGCIFCAAEGRETAVHPNLDALMSHILSKHKTAMMTPEVKAKTMCIVGGSPEKTQVWDINLPQTHRRKLGGFVGEYVAKAVHGLS
ncbi:hypothetical protein CLAFUW4_11289 [Fulvia fulva]|uniref:Uncharacterized protein n=1 Tax=Passalora fulva TaxID=5499 RepID=A0A9Q8PC03_PASFU|nr:uncharacterized protein CLAFUR5_10330 [Fulvia fulva]KAK4620097.1 hypothetical protein CLAFUR4_11295 [Fulvia fulva]KAK4620670.1 hypothetical protein CLAFUR0_11300 [Fulvia fulva]UJO19655.1 hypothetical protein CLAFUR5_10330 [Fulvia fulva]WPV17503.1 hypothetical protein CLAFUW4_11289 [Fulvia fulva]WPV32143.1 hypothetical protein CLAFUW7_11285 [Fulvia fulva]